MVRKHREKACEAPDIEETKEHVLAAGREILLAARGALRFCKSYVEAASAPESRPELMKFFQHAIEVADDLSRGICSIDAIKETASNIAKPVMDILEQEMEKEPEAEIETKKKKRKAKKTAGHRRRT